MVLINDILDAKITNKYEYLCALLFFFVFLQGESYLSLQCSMKRESNFEVMRTLAMFFIVAYHCLTHGVGGEYSFSIVQPALLSNLLFSDFMLVFSSIAVNLYVMISGYFLVDLDFKLSRIVRTWVISCFYLFIITLLFISLDFEPFSIVTIGKSLFPLSTDAYWFVTQYIGLLILSPFLSIMIRKLTYRQYVGLLIGGAFICLAIIPDFPLGKRFHVAHGNSLLSFVYLFVVAGFIRHHLEQLPMKKLLAAITVVVLMTLTYELFVGTHQNTSNLVWLDYNSLPFILSVLIFILVKQVHVPDNIWWNSFVKLAPYTFGVYLIHDHLLVRGWLWDTISLTSQCQEWVFPLIVIGVCLLIFLTCSLIEAIRKKLFEITRLDSLIAEMDNWRFTCIRS